MRAYWRVCISISVLISFFFFQAEDGIRDYKVTGVQTCALPISAIGERTLNRSRGHHAATAAIAFHVPGLPLVVQDRKSTRLNSSHLVMSYAVFYLKKKKKNR